MVSELGTVVVIFAGVVSSGASAVVEDVAGAMGDTASICFATGGEDTQVEVANPGASSVEAAAPSSAAMTNVPVISQSYKEVTNFPW